MAEPETTNKGDLEDLFGDSDDEDFQPVEQQPQPLDDAEAAPAGVRPYHLGRARISDRQLQVLCMPLHVRSSEKISKDVVVSTGRSRGRV